MTKGVESVEDWVAIIAHYRVDMSKVKPKTPIDNGKWLDDVEVKWEVCYKPEGAAMKMQNFVKMVKKVKYNSVAHGKRRAVILISPKHIERYFNGGKKSFLRELKVRFSMKVGGKTVKGMTVYLDKGRPDKTAKFKSVFESEDTFSLDGILLNRNESPFKSAQTDSFEIIVEDKK